MVSGHNEDKCFADRGQARAAYRLNVLILANPSNSWRIKCDERLGEHVEKRKRAAKRNIVLVVSFGGPHEEDTVHAMRGQERRGIASSILFSCRHINCLGPKLITLDPALNEDVCKVFKSVALPVSLP